MSDLLTTYLELALSGEMKNGASLARARRQDDNTDTGADNNADTGATGNTDTGASGNTDSGATDNNDGGNIEPGPPANVIDGTNDGTDDVADDTENSAVVAGATACLLTTLFSL